MMRGREFLARLREEVLIGDGALGTMFSERGVSRDTACERLNLTHPSVVKDLHAAYLAAGAQMIETNTFGANRTKLVLEPGDAGANLCARDLGDINRTGVALAREAAGTGAYVAGAIGPLAERAAQQGHDHPPLTDDQVRDIFREQAVALADAGADLLILETFTDLHQILLALAAAKKHTDLPVVCHLAFHERGHTYTGVHASTAVEALVAAGADVVGTNCGRGVRCVMAAVEAMTRAGEALVSAFPNAGLPAYVDGRYIFGAPLPYLVDCAERMAEQGVNLLGGCCGTTPEYIRRIAERLKGRRPALRVSVPAEPPPAQSGVVQLEAVLISGSILERYADEVPAEPAPSRPRPLVVVELDPPKDLRYEPVVKRARQLRDMGVDAITMADNPVATLHMGNMALAQIVQQEADIPVIVHLTCRDHNLLGLQSLLLSAHVMGLHHLLALTGDPARVGNQPGATSVYDLNSFGLVELIRKFNGGVTNAGKPLGQPTRFVVGVAFNPNGRNLPGQVARLRKKVLAGAHFAMTQPVYDPHRFDEMTEALRALPVPEGGLPRFPVLSGIMPLLSERNAEYLHNEVPGICLTDDVRARMKGLSGPEGRKVGVRICQELIDHMAERADGFYIVPSQIRTEMAVELVAHLNSRLPRAEENLVPAASTLPRVG
jgi:methionine synthase / methylenetetrahydrofolate reductase (NADH)